MTSPLKTSQADRRDWMILFLAGLLYLSTIQITGRFPNIEGDEIFYKAPGREWSKSGRFAAPELAGYLGVDPPLEELWLVYPPVYPFSFGLFTEAFGFGRRQAVMFDGLVHVLLAFTTFALARRLSFNQNSLPALLAAIAILPLGVPGRPDDLATLFGMLGILVVARPYDDKRDFLRLPRLCLLGVFGGLCFATSPIAGVTLAIVASTMIAFQARTLVAFLRAAIVSDICAVLVFLLTIAPIMAIDPDVPNQFIAQCKVIASDTRTYLQRMIAVVFIGKAVSLPVLGILVLGVVAGMFAWHRGNLTHWLYLWLGPLLGLAFLLAIKLHLYLYLWFLMPYSLAAVSVSIADPAIVPSSIGRLLLTAAAVSLIAVSSVFFLREMLLLALLPDDQRFDHNVQLVQDVIPAGSTLWTYELWWGLGNDYRVFEHQVPPSRWNEIDFVVINTNRPYGTDASNPGSIDHYIQEHFTPVHDYRNSKPIQFLGLRLSRSIRGYGPLILRRTMESGNPSNIDISSKYQREGNQSGKKRFPDILASDRANH